MTGADTPIESPLAERTVIETTKIAGSPTRAHARLAGGTAHARARQLVTVKLAPILITSLFILNH